MAIVRVFENPDGSVRVMRLNERHRLVGETDAQFFGRETAKQPELTGLPFVDMDSADLPPNRADRYKWRLQGGRVRVDMTVPDPPDPQKAIRDEITQATTIDQLKAAMLKIL